MVLIKIFLPNKSLLIFFFFMMKFWIFLYATKALFFQKLSSTQKSTSFISGRNKKLLWLLCESIPLTVTNSLVVWFMWPRSNIGCKVGERKAICHCSSYQHTMSGHNYREKRNASKHAFHHVWLSSKSNRANCYL